VGREEEGMWGREAWKRKGEKKRGERKCKEAKVKSGGFVDGSHEWGRAGSDDCERVWYGMKW